MRLSESEDLEPGSRFLLLVTIAGSAGVLALLHRFYHDDAFIILRYARNLLDGHGLVWNAGERVEGYTSLSWVLGCALLGWTGLDLQTASRLLGVASFIALLALLYRRKEPAGPRTAALVASCGAVAGWSLGGLETTGFALCATAALLAAERVLDSGGDALWTAACAAGLLYGIAEWTRPEGALLAAVFFSCLGLAWIARGFSRIGPLLAAGGGFALLFIPRLAWRVWYYGDWVPNTFHVKAGRGFEDAALGANYIGRFFLFTPVMALLSVAILLSLRKRRFTPGEWGLAASLAAFLAHVTWVGGDHMQWFRFLVPVIPVWTILGVRRLPDALPSGLPRPARRAVFPALLAVQLTSTAATTWTKAWNEPDPASRYGEAVGRWVGAHWSPDSLVALNTAGSTAWFGGTRCIDMLGLNDRTIATRRMPPPPPDLKWASKPGHRKGDGAYVLSRRPDYIIIGGSAGEGPDKPWFVGDREIVESPEFRGEFVLRETDIPADGDLPPVHFKYFQRAEP